MRASVKTCLPLAVLLTLTGCEDYAADWVKKVRSKVQSEQANWVSVPALPVIEDAVFELTPPPGKRSNRLMSQVCDLVQGEITQDEARKVLDDLSEEQKPDAEKLINAGKANQATACAAFMATIVLIPVNINEFSHPIEPEEEGGVSSLQIDKPRLNLTLALKMTTARTNADIFALIAKHLEQQPGLTIEEYREKAKELFAALAPTYLQRVKENMLPPGTEYTLLSMNAARFTFNTSSGALYEYGYDGLTLRQNNIVWYGYGKLLGTEYTLQARYFDDQVAKTLRYLQKRTQ